MKPTKTVFVPHPEGAPPRASSIMTAEEFEDALDDHVADALDVQDNFKGSTVDALEAASSNFLMNLPALTSRRRVQLYLACVARGMQLNLLDADTSKRCVYIAQLALAAFGTQNGEPVPAVRSTR